LANLANLANLAKVVKVVKVVRKGAKLVVPHLVEAERSHMPTVSF
jgi:hypothetical protein